MSAAAPLAPPVGLLAELTHRCPLRCPYCSNPVELDRRAQELPTESWQRVFAQAGALGVLQVHLSGGEPLARPDLPVLVEACATAGLYSNLITSGLGLSQARLELLLVAGLDHVQLSLQDSEPSSAERIAGATGVFARKLAAARLVTEAGLPLTVNVVLHRANIARAGELVDLAVALGARRVEIAHTQYYGWALKNRAALQPDQAQVRQALADVAAAKARHAGKIVVDQVVPDYHARYPKACMGGWARRSLNVTPSGLALPCHAAQTIPNLEFWSVEQHSLAEIWQRAPAFLAFRGTDWMQEPCRSCARREQDFGGCRCQAMAILGDPSATDPVCTLSPFRHRIDQALADDQGEEGYRYREMPRAAETVG